MRLLHSIMFALASLLVIAPAQALSPYYFFFDSGSSRLTPHALSMLETAVAGIALTHAVEIEIVGAADRAGSEAHNMALSRRRAEAIRSALLARGMSRSVIVRITAIGEATPLVETEDGVAEAQNRFAYVLLRRFATTTPLLRQEGH